MKKRMGKLNSERRKLRKLGDCKNKNKRNTNKKSSLN